MKLYDEVIKNVGRLVSDAAGSAGAKGYALQEARDWEDAGKANMILRSDMAYELGGSSTSLYALGRTVITMDEEVFASFAPDAITLLGPDIGALSTDVSYARFLVALVDEERMGEGDALYNAIRDIEYVRYHVNPRGFMMRVSASHHRESVRISRDAIAEGLDFAAVGKAFLKELEKNQRIKAAKVVFITEPSFDFAGLEREIRRAEDITKTIDHVFKDMKMDCNACGLKQVCDEVEGLRELHFANSNGGEQ